MHAPTPETIATTARLLRAGGVAIIPTDTVYGIAAHPACASAVGRICTIKGRPTGKPIALLAADMVEDTVPFITDPAAIPAHVQNYARLRGLGLKTLLPNHCRLRALESGGYPPEIIEASAHYLDSLYKLLAANPDAEVPEVKQFMGKYLDSGLLAYWPPYERVHTTNARKLRDYFKSR